MIENKKLGFNKIDDTIRDMDNDIYLVLVRTFTDGELGILDSGISDEIDSLC